MLKATARRIWYEVLRRARGGDVAARFLGVTVGRGCRIITRGFGTEPWLVSIGDRVTATNNVSFITHDGSTWLVRDAKGRRFRYARIQVGNDVFIGINSIILPGVRIGDRVIVGAGSVVTKSIPSGSIVAGNPARIIGRFEDYERRALAEFPTAAVGVGGLAWREWVNRVVEQDFRSEMEGRRPIPR